MGKEKAIKKAYLESVSKSGLFRYLKEEDYERAWKELNMAPRAYEDQQTIYGQGDQVKRGAIVHSGLVKGEKFHVEGTSHLAHMYTSGEPFAFEGAVSGKRTSPLDFISEGETTIIFFDVQKIFSNSFQLQLVKGFMEVLANDNIKKLYRIETLSKRGLRDRIVTYFRILSAKSGSSKITLELSRMQLAHYLCVNRTALSYELNQMQREGIIRMDRKTITILKEL
ncbi:Crp/Fnr family transcriptional regulator [bacterium 210820-DFI.6.37]|nr:Crp/Fnr family transcriptional regulator [bacterium 210820-DFI.6.37]